MNYTSCENCCYRYAKICLYYSKEVNIIANGKSTTKATILPIKNNWYCKKFNPSMSMDCVNDLNRELEKDSIDR